MGLVTTRAGRSRPFNAAFDQPLAVTLARLERLTEDGFLPIPGETRAAFGVTGLVEGDRVRLRLYQAHVWGWVGQPLIVQGSIDAAGTTSSLRGSIAAERKPTNWWAVLFEALIIGGALLAIWLPHQRITVAGLVLLWAASLVFVLTVAFVAGIVEESFTLRQAKTVTAALRAI
jgi:hypothetical protein